MPGMVLLAEDVTADGRGHPRPAEELTLWSPSGLCCGGRAWLWGGEGVVCNAGNPISSLGVEKLPGEAAVRYCMS